MKGIIVLYLDYLFSLDCIYLKLVLCFLIFEYYLFLVGNGWKKNGIVRVGGNCFFEY